MIKLAKNKAKKKKIKAEFFVSDMSKKLPFENNFFGYAISISAIHCLPPKAHKKAIEELYRVMKPRSKSLIGVWNFNSKRFNQKKGKEKLIKWTDKGERYYYLFTEEEIHDLFKKADFKILSTHNSEMMINFIVVKN
jgi:ubiquinone/menaquinone biosynthesis C-methylase UbiE